jgi:hypothetical protein
MSKKIIVIGASISNAIYNIQVVLWYPITSGQKTTTGVSTWAGASTAENSALQNGSVLEEVQNFQFPVNLPTTEIKIYLDQYWTNRNSNLGGVGPGLFANVFEDSITGWSA